MYLREKNDIRQYSGGDGGDGPEAYSWLDNIINELS